MSYLSISEYISMFYHLFRLLNGQRDAYILNCTSYEAHCSLKYHILTRNTINMSGVKVNRKWNHGIVVCTFSSHKYILILADCLSTEETHCYCCPHSNRVDFHHYFLNKRERAMMLLVRKNWLDKASVLNKVMKIPE